MKLLLDAGADKSLQTSDGKVAEELTTDGKILEALGSSVRKGDCATPFLLLFVVQLGSHRLEMWKSAAQVLGIGILVWDKNIFGHQRKLQSFRNSCHC